MQSRNISVGELFDKNSGERIPNIEGWFKQIKHAKQKQLRVWWDIATLEIYIAAQITPRRV